ncbi:MAG: 3-hydroxyacyl-CoA dehydrogenase [Rickettsiales bacterium]|nr:3-hydroxyacyl-CoA dehydrogenase [Rickettsiales bacterium]
MAKNPNSSEFTVGILGAGAMGRGIAQIIATGGMHVLLFDANDDVVEAGREFAERMIFRAGEKGTITDEEAKASVARLSVANQLSDLRNSDLVIEAVSEDLDIKRKVFLGLEEVVAEGCILATNTSSLSVAAIAAVLKYPGRFAGFHFFNPVPLMKVVEVVSGLETTPTTTATLDAVARRAGHEPVRAKDTPGFLVNHAGRGLNTEGVRVVSEGITDFKGVDDLLREGGPKFRMGPFELMDTTGLDVSHPVMESIYQQFYEEPRFRPHPLTRQRAAAGLHGRKTGRGFYTYQDNKKVIPPVEETPNILPEAIWVSKAEPDGYEILTSALSDIVEIDDGKKPSTRSLCLFSPLGWDITSAAVAESIEAERSFGVDTMFGLDGRRTLMSTPVSDPDLRDMVHAALAVGGHAVTIVRDSPGFVNQRVVSTVVNIACDIAQQRIANPSDIDKAVKLGLGYPIGPLALGDSVGPRRILQVLNAMQEFYGDPRYRPSPWLKRRAMLGVSLLTEEN